MSTVGSTFDASSSSSPPLPLPPTLLPPRTAAEGGGVAGDRGDDGRFSGADRTDEDLVRFLKLAISMSRRVHGERLEKLRHDRITLRACKKERNRILKKHLVGGGDAQDSEIDTIIEEANKDVKELERDAGNGLSILKL